jgi:crotonobetainyl-CoA:carnitine CoA-transferase CaiB-like acyl-CoA transferase
MSRALEGITVVALEQAVAAPVASSRLADAGARVIKLERPEGDFARGYDDFVLGQASYHVWINRGKESIAVDLKSAADNALVQAMLAGADVFLQNLAPGAAARLGLGADALRARHPRLVCCDVSGYAPGTPAYHAKAYDLLIQAETGLAWATGTAASGPSRVGVSVCDIVTGQVAYGAIVEALFRRERTGEGAHLEVSLFDAIADFMNVPYLTHRYGGIEPPRLGLAHPSIAPYGVFHLSDGDVLIAVQSEPEWRVLCERVLGDAALAADPRFDRNVHRIRHRAELDAAVQARLAGRTVAALVADLDAARIAYGRVSDLAVLAAHPSASFLAVETPAGPVEVLAPPVIVDGRRAAPGRVPALDEHGAALRAEFDPARTPAEAGR